MAKAAKKAVKKAAPKMKAAPRKGHPVEVVKSADKELEKIAKAEKERADHLEEMRVSRAAGLNF